MSTSITLTLGRYDDCWVVLKNMSVSDELNILSYFGIISPDFFETLLFVMLGGSLADLITESRTSKMRPGESELAQILLQVAKGLKYIHSQGLVHLDIKPG